MKGFFAETVFVAILAILFGLVVPGILLAAEEHAVDSTAEWEQVTASDTKLPPLTISELRVEFEKSVEPVRALRSWEARCRVTSHIEDRPMEDYSALLISQAEQWIDERRQGKWEDENSEYRKVCDGQCVWNVTSLRNQKSIWIGTLSHFVKIEGVAAERPKLPLGFPPFLLLPREHYYPLPEAFPDICEILADPAAKVLPWRTRVEGHECYVVERTASTESPIFKSQEEALAWRAQNPERKVVLNVNPNSKPGDKRIDEQIDRLALDPRCGFMMVRWARGGRLVIPGYTVKETGLEVPQVEVSTFPGEEIFCTDFRELGGSGRIPGRMEYRRYSPKVQGEPELLARREVVLEDFQADRVYPADLFRVDPQPGSLVLDSVREIQYTVGESEEQIPVLLAAAEAKKAFLDELKRQPAPPLEASCWLNSEPIRLEDVRGKPVQLHFWSIGCGPCIQELPRLQENWERSGRVYATPPILISVHPYVDGDGLQALKDLLRAKRITYPVMVDANAPGVMYWGKTSADYRVSSVPSDVWIDEEGHVTRHDLERNWISASQAHRWLDSEPPVKGAPTADGEGR